MCATLVCEIRGGLTALNAREFGSTPNLDDAEGVLSPRMDTWMHWRLDRRVLTVNWSDAMPLSSYPVRLSRSTTECRLLDSESTLQVKPAACISPEPP